MIGHLLAKMPPRAADWGWNVTICIGALSESRKAIVCVNDTRVSFKDFSSDTLADKNKPFYAHWTALVADNDTEYADPILERAYTALLGKVKIGQYPTPTEIGEAVQASWWKQLDE